jgi:alpha-tubulin suppressor-like RCC1 family protein
VAVVGGHVFRVISAGEGHTCGVTTAGAAYCWGGNLWGDLGMGDPNSPASSTPLAVVGGHSFATISAGNGLTVALKATGEAYAWGKCDIVGVTLVDLCDMFWAEPGAVLGGHQFVKVSAGGFHICALEASGAAWCWGYEGGNGTSGRTRVPLQLPGGLKFVSIDAGFHHTVALTASGAAYAWGENSFGQVGNGATAFYVYGPVAVVGGHTFRSVAAGGSHSAAVATDGHAFAWGSNAAGQLGTGNTTGSSTPTPVSGSVVFR